MNRLKNDILSDLSKVQEYQFMSLCKLLSSEPFMLIFKDLWKADDLKSLFTLLKKFLPQLFKNFSQNTDLREKRLLQTSMSDILKAIKNIKEHLPDKLDSSNIELLNESGKDILYKLKSQGDIKGAIKNAELEYEERVIAISYIESIENSSKARTLFKMFLQNIASHNIWTLKSDELQKLFQIMSKYGLRNKNLMLKVLPNLSTMLEENLPLILKKGEAQMKHDEAYMKDVVNTESTQISNEEAQFRREVLSSYIELFRRYKDEFEVNDYNLSGLSRLSVPIFDSMSHENIMVKVYCNF